MNTADGHIYAVLFDDGRVKVGRTTGTPGLRFTAHRCQARAHGGSVTDTWVSPRHVEFAANEKRFIGWAAERASGVMAKEYFAGLEFAEVVGFGSQLPMSPPVILPEPEPSPAQLAQRARSNLRDWSRSTAESIARLDAAMALAFEAGLSVAEIARLADVDHRTVIEWALLRNDEWTEVAS